MNSLPQIQPRNGANVVSAREVWQFLEIKKQFADWIKHRIKKYGLIEGQDFLTFSLNSEKGRPEIEYHLTIDAAKQLAMVEGNDKGREARQYFIDCENALNQVSEVITAAQQKISENQKKSFELLQELQTIKAENAPTFKRMNAIKKELKRLQNENFQQLGLFQEPNAKQAIN